MASSIAVSITARGNPSPRKAAENRLRIMAQRQGLTLHKSRRRDPRAVDYGALWLMDEYGHCVAGDALKGPGDLSAIATYLLAHRGADSVTGWDPATYACPVCGAVSHSPADRQEGFCARCRDWTGICQVGRKITSQTPGWDGPCPTAADGGWGLLTDAGQLIRVAVCRPHRVALSVLPPAQVTALPDWLTT